MNSRICPHHEIRPDKTSQLLPDLQYVKWKHFEYLTIKYELLQIKTKCEDDLFTYYMAFRTIMKHDHNESVSFIHDKENIL